MAGGYPYPPIAIIARFFLSSKFSNDLMPPSLDFLFHTASLMSGSISSPLLIAESRSVSESENRQFFAVVLQN